MGKNLIKFCGTEIVPYYLSEDKKITFLFEMKSDDYIPPFFNNSLGVLGGNRGKIESRSPEEVLERELKEEFHIIDEKEESLNELLGQEVLQEKNITNFLNYDERTVEDIKRIPPVLLENKVYAGSYLSTFFPPLAGIKRKIMGIESIFTKELSDEEYLFINTLLKKTDGRLTTDNLKHGGKTLFASLDELNDNRYKFSWGIDQIIRNLLKRDTFPIPSGYPIAIRSMDDIKIKLIHSKTGCPTFEEFESMGFTYNTS